MRDQIGAVQARESARRSRRYWIRIRNGQGQERVLVVGGRVVAVDAARDNALVPGGSNLPAGRSAVSDNRDRPPLAGIEAEPHPAVGKTVDDVMIAVDGLDAAVEGDHLHLVAIRAD